MSADGGESMDDELGEEVRRIPSIVSDTTDVMPAAPTGEDCVICLVPMTSDCVRTPCGHYFHEACLDQYLVSRRQDDPSRSAPRPRCPVCRGSMRRPLPIEAASTSGLRIEVTDLPQVGGYCHFDRGYTFLDLGGFQTPGMLYVQTCNEDRRTPTTNVMWTLQVAVRVIVHLNFRSEGHVNDTGVNSWLGSGGWHRSRSVRSAVTSGFPNGPYSGPVYSKCCEAGSRVELMGSNTWEGVYFVFVQVENPRPNIMRLFREAPPPPEAEEQEDAAAYLLRPEWFMMVAPQLQRLSQTQAGDRMPQQEGADDDLQGEESQPEPEASPGAEEAAPEPRWEEAVEDHSRGEPEQSRGTTLTVPPRRSARGRAAEPSASSTNAAASAVAAASGVLRAAAATAASSSAGEAGLRNSQARTSRHSRLAALSQAVSRDPASTDEAADADMPAAVAPEASGTSAAPGRVLTRVTPRRQRPDAHPSTSRSSAVAAATPQPPGQPRGSAAAVATRVTRRSGQWAARGSMAHELQGGSAAARLLGEPCTHDSSRQHEATSGSSAAQGAAAASIEASAGSVPTRGHSLPTRRDRSPANGRPRLSPHPPADAAAASRTPTPRRLRASRAGGAGQVRDTSEPRARSTSTRLSIPGAVPSRSEQESDVDMTHF